MEPLLESGRQSLSSISFFEIGCTLCVIDVLDVRRARLPETLCGEPEPSSEGRPLSRIVSQTREQIPSNQHEPLRLDLSKERDQPAPLLLKLGIHHHVFFLTGSGRRIASSRTPNAGSRLPSRRAAPLPLGLIPPILGLAASGYAATGPLQIEVRVALVASRLYEPERIPTLLA